MASRGSRVVTGILGVLGELMITAGFIIAGYLVWDIWYDSGQKAAVAEEQVIEFQESLTPSPRIKADLITEGEPPSITRVGEGDTFGVLIIPTWYGKSHNKMPIREGTETYILDAAAAGHYKDTAMPGEVGNFSVAGHRRTHGNSFRFVNELEPGDQIIVQTADTWFVYEMAYDQIVLPTQTEVILPNPDSPEEAPVDRYLTMTTCHSPQTGEWGNSHRWITHAKLVGWMDRADGMPEQVLNDPGVL